MPPRFQSGIHDHTIFACIAPLEGAEQNTFYERRPEGGLRVAGTRTVRPGEVLDLPADVIHSIENPDLSPASALHVYGGDFRAVQQRRTLWTSGDHEEQPFSFPALLRESARAMKRDGNETGLEELVRAVPEAKAVVDTLS